MVPSRSATNINRQRTSRVLLLMFIRVVLVVSIGLNCWLVSDRLVDPCGTPAPTPAPNNHVPPPITPIHASNLAYQSSRIWAVYICNDLEDPMQHKKIMELQDIFWHKLVVITDQNRNQRFKTLPYYDRIVFDQTYTRKHLWNFKGYGLEKAMMWLISNKGKFDHAWVIEEDVYWKSKKKLEQFFKSYNNDNVDFLHQNMGMEDQNILSKDSEEWNWWNLHHLRRPRVAAEIGPPYYHGLFMLYRLSSRATKKLNAWRLHNAGEWTFFEPLLSTLPVQDPDLTTKSFMNNSAGYEFHLDYRPCFTKEDIYGQLSTYPNGDCFHPVKKGYAACSA